MGKTAKEILEEMRNGNKTNTKTNNTSNGGSGKSAKSILAEMKLSTLSNKINSYSKSANALYNEHNSRYYDTDGKPLAVTYRSDYSDWRDKVRKQSYSLETQAKEINDILFEYGDYYDDDYVSKIKDAIKPESYHSIREQANSDYDYYSQFADEDSYNRAMTYAKEQEEKQNKYSSMSDEELDAEIERLEGSKKDNKIFNLAMMVVGAQHDAKYNTDFYGEAKSHQAYNDSVDNDISLIEKEKTNRKYKQIDELPGDVRSLIDELTVIDSSNDDDEFVNDANVLISGLTGGSNVNYNADSDSKRFGEIVQALESKGIENWHELLEYNKLRYNEKKNAPIKEADAEMAKEHPFLSSLATIPASLGKGIGVVEMLENIGSDTPLDPNSPYFSMNNFVNTTRETVMDEHDFHLNTGNKTLDNIDLFDELYGTAMSMGDSVTAGVGLGGIGGVALGLSAATDSAQEVAENGGSSTEALVTGLVSGVNEMLWESLSLGRLNDLISNGVSKRGFKAFVGELFKSMGINASEEFNTEASNLLADYLINGGASAYSETVQNYLAMGYTDDEAKGQAKKDMLVQMTKAGVGGALQGLFMGVGGGAISSSLNAIESKSNENKYYNNVGQSIIDQGNLSQLVEETEALGNERALKSLKDLANQVSGVKTEELDAKGSKKYAHQVGKLYKGVQKAQLENLSKSSETAFRNVIKAELEKTGVNDVDKTVDILVKAAHNEGLTRAENKLLQSVNGHEILNKAYSSKEFVESLNAEEKKQFEEGRDNILDTVDLTRNKGKAKILSESEYDISSDAKTTIEATGEEVDIVSIDSLDGDDISLSVKSGDSKQVVLAGELRLNEDYVVILEGLKDIKADFGLDVSSANSILALWDGYNGDVVDFSKAMKSGLMYGQYNMRKDFENSRMGRNVPDNIRNRLFEIGGEYKQRVVDKQESDVKANGNANAENGEFSITYAEGVTYENLNKSQKAQIDFAQVIAQTFGFNLEIFRSPKNALGQSVGENGSYNLGTNTMRLDIDAGTLDGKSLILFTQSHELTHFIKKWSPKAFKTFADLLVEKYGSKGVSVEKLVNDKITQSIINRGKDHALSYDEAFEEVVCDACEDFLADPNIQQTITEFAKVDKNLAQKIKDFLKGLITKLEEAIKGLQGQSAEAKALRELDVEDLEELKNHWSAALFDARENVLQARENKAQKNTTDEGDVKLSVREDFAEQLQDWKNGFGKAYGKYNGSYFNLGTTSDVLVKHGASKTDLIMYEECILKVTGGKHSISLDEIAKLPYELDDPVLLFKGSVNNSFVALTEMVDKEGNDVIVAVHINKKHKRTVINKIASIYSKSDDFGNNKITNYVSKQISDGNLLDASIKKAPMWFTNRGLQLPKLVQTIINADNSIRNYTENVKSVDENPTIAGIDYDSLSSAKNENGDELFQYRAIQHDVPEYRALLEEYSDMSSEQIDALFETMNKAFAIIEDNLEILDYAWDENLNEDGTWDDTVDARAFNPVKPNSDRLYKYSLDFSTMCRKRLLQQVIAEELSLALDRAVTKAEGIAIRNELIKLQEEGRQIEIACALCYVESARMKSPEQIQKFLNDAGQMVREFFATKAKGGIAEAEEKARKSVAKKYAQEIKEGSVSPTDTYTTKGGKVKYIPLSKLPKKMKDEIHKAKREAKSSYSPSAEEQRLIDIASNLPVTAFTTAEGLKNLAKDNPVIFDAYTSFVRNATHSKGTEKDVWYRVGDANKIGDDLIAAMNKENGLRSQSWSDFQVIHLLDYVGAIIELSTKKAKMQAYTKVPDYVNLMGLTGQMINLSLIPARDFNGKLEFDSVEGMAFEVARKLRDKYPDTAGTISIGITNKQIQMLLDSMDIDYVIPYHHSAMSKVVRKAMHIPSWVTYQDYQNEKNITSKKDALANAKKYGVQLLNTSDKNYHKAPSFSEWFDLEEARQVAQLENLNPTDLKAQKKYGVMYGAYKAMQQAADNYLKICAERGLVPKFCHEKADFTVEDNYWKLLIDRKMINQKTGEIIEQKPVQPIFNEGEVLNILNNEIARYEDVKKDFDYATRIVTERFLNGDMNEHISEIAKAIGDTVTNVTKVAILNSDIKNQDRDSTERRSAVRTPVAEIYKNFSKYSRSDLESIAEELFWGVDGGSGLGYKYKSTEDLKAELFDVISDMMSDLTPKEANSVEFGFFVSPLPVANNVADEKIAEEAPKIMVKGKVMRKWLEKELHYCSDVLADMGKNYSSFAEWVEDMGAWDVAEFILTDVGTDFDSNSPLHNMIYAIEKMHEGYSQSDVLTHAWLWHVITNYVDGELDGNEFTYTKSTDVDDTPWLSGDDDDIRYQDRVTPEQDAEYLELAKNPEKNEVRLREMVEEAAKKAGYTIKAYHGTPSNDFTTFDAKKIGSNTDVGIFGSGFYFTTNKDTAGVYATERGHTMSVYLRVNNPWWAVAHRNIQDVAEKLGMSEVALTLRGYGGKGKIVTPTMSQTGQFSAHLQEHGYDAVVVQHGSNNYEIVVFDSNAIKSADLVTYDNGNIIPLSERFNEGNNDIRYQDRVYNGSLTQNRIDYIIKDSGAGSRVDYANMWIASINPSDFIDLTLRYETRAKGREVFDEKVEGDYGGVMADRDYISDLKHSREMPYLVVDIDTGKVIGHNGRHRMRALEKAGASRTPIGIKFYKDEHLYKGNDNGVRLETIELKRLISQFDDRAYSQYNAYIHNIIPLNEDHRAEIEKAYRARPMDVEYGFTVAYQDRPISVREVLVDAMENIEELSIEDQNRLEIYKGKIENINELEKELADVGKQIHKIITTKGSDRKQMAELNAKADTLRKQISRVDGELLRIEAMKPIKNLVEIRKKQVLKAHKQKVQEQRHKNVEGRHKTATKNKIKKVIKTLESLYSNPTKEKNVKKEFQDMVRDALVLANVLFDDGNISSSDILSGNLTIRLGENEKKKLDEWRKVYKSRQDYRDKLDALESSGKVNQKTHDELLDMINKCNNKLNRLGRDLSDVVERQKAELNEESLKNAIGSLVKAYKSLKESPEGYAQAAYNDFVAKRLETLEESLAKATVKSMTLTQLDELYQAYKMVLTTVRTANDIFVKNKRMSVVDMGEAVISEIKKVANPTENKIAALKGIREFSWEELKPVYAFERIGSETFMQLYKEVLRGQDVVARDIAEAQAFFDKMNKTYGYDSWDLKETKDFKLADGRTFTINLQEIMSIYAYSKREQALDHITNGGFVFDNKEFFTDTKEKGLKGKIKKQRTTVKAYRINDEMFYKIINSLTKEQKKFAEEMQDYLTSMGEKGNEVSRVLYGIDIFNEKHYFPLMSSKAFIQQTNEPVGTVTLKNSGMTKATVPHARNPIVLQGFMDVWANHINKMSTYHGLVLPIENLNKVFNYTGYAHEDESVSVETILSGAYGDEVNKYIENFITDLNGGIKTQSSGNWVTKGISLFKKTAVAASTSVVVQQPTAIVRAMAMINPKYFVHGKDGIKHKEAWEKIKKYAPIAIVKEMGGFDVGSGRQVSDYITAKEYKGKDKVKGFFTDSTYRDDALMWGATKADEFGWITIWNAVEKAIADTTTYKVGSEEFLQACGERFTEVIDYTQVYDSVLSRSGFMRNKGEISKMATSFMGEPTTSFNMLYNAILQAKRGNIGKGEMTKIMGATVSSIILASIAKSLIYALRDDDEDESYAEKYAQSLTNSLMEDLFIPNMLPYVSDITSLLSGWDVERTDMAILKDFKDAVDDLDSSNKSLWRKIEDLGGAVAAFGGIPAKNVMRTVREIYNLVANALDDNTASVSDVGDAIVETVVGETSSSDINEALEKGNTAKAKKIINDLVADKVKQGKTQKEAKASIKASVTSYWKELYLQAYRDKDNAEMLRIRQILQSTGLYDNVVETCSNWIKSMKDETTNTIYKKW